MPAHPTTVSLRSDAAEAPTTRSDCRKRSGPENAHPHREHVAMSKMGHVDPARITKASSRSISPMTVVNRTRTLPVAAAGP